MTLTLPSARTSLDLDLKLRERAARVIPGGMYGHMRIKPQSMPPSYPQFYTRGSGTRAWDTDGNEYIDFMCAYGPMVLGYANPEVDAAAAAQQRNGDALAGPSPHMVELAELLTDTVAHADWAMFSKNGTDATSIAVTVARAATGKAKVLKAVKAYHGANAWFTPYPTGTTAEDRANFVEFEYNDIASLRAAAASVDGDVAAIIVTPIRHDVFVDEEEIDPEFARAVRELSTSIGAVFILDEVRTCLRIDMAGALESIGVRPDITAYSKSLANGYALAATVGVDSLAEAASSIYVTGSFWYSGVAMAAARTTIDIMRNTNGIARMNAAGARLMAGLTEQAAGVGLELVMSGPRAMPMMRFVGDTETKIGFAFTDAAIRRGVLLHPWHTMFVSAAHTLDEVEAALELTSDAFDEVKRLGF